MEHAFTMNLTAATSQPAPLRQAEDITIIWDRSHPHLRPLSQALPVQGADGPTLRISAHLRIGADTWFELATIHYEPAQQRFLLTAEDRLALLGDRADLLQAR